MKSKQVIKTLLLIFCLAPFVNVAADDKDEFTFTTVKENPITSIKNQSRSGTCWCYSGLGFFENELLREGKEAQDLCESFVVYHTYMDRAAAAVRTHGDISFSQGGSFYDVLYCLQNYGICPQEAMVVPGSLYGDTLFNFNEMSEVSNAYVGAIAKGKFKKLSPCWKNGLIGIYDSYIGKTPKTFEKDGKTFTPKEYVKELGLNLDDYVSLTSYTHHPFYSKFILEIQDNWRWASSYNLPLDEFMNVCKNAILKGYTFAWGSDVSEPNFNYNGVALIIDKNAKESLEGSDQANWTGKSGEKKDSVKQEKVIIEKTITQEMRQEAYDNWQTTDDHGMVIYGIAKDQNDKEYFMVKNSWGQYGKYKGMFYASFPFVSYKTMNILINKKAIPKKIRKKLGL